MTELEVKFLLKYPNTWLRFTKWIKGKDVGVFKDGLTHYDEYVVYQFISECGIYKNPPENHSSHTMKLVKHKEFPYVCLHCSCGETWSDIVRALHFLVLEHNNKCARKK